MDKKTPLYDWHAGNGGKIYPYASYLLPIQYETGIINEHMAVREKAGLFDVSHMGEFFISGKDAYQAIQLLFTNDFSSLKEGRVRYTLMCNLAGGIIDDLIVYKMKDDLFLLVVNAANREKDAAWIKNHLDLFRQERKIEAFFEDASDNYAQAALQGPASVKILSMLIGDIPQQYYSFIEKAKIAEIECLISRTGYTGEIGFEIYCKNEDIKIIWEKLLLAGRDEGLIACGLGARDTLRLEASMPLYGHEMSEEIDPFEAELSFAVKMDKSSFLGKEALARKIKMEKSRIRTGLRALERGVLRENCPVYMDNTEIGITTSGTYLPYLKQSMAMAMIQTESNIPGKEAEIEVRGKLIKAEICKLPFYKRANI